MAAEAEYTVLPEAVFTITSYTPDAVVLTLTKSLAGLGYMSRATSPSAAGADPITETVELDKAVLLLGI